MRENLDIEMRLPLQPPCPLATAISGSTTLSFVIPSIHRLSSAVPPGLIFANRGLHLRHRGTCRGHAQNDASPFPRLANNFHLAAVEQHDSLHDRQTEARAARGL